MVTLSFQLLLDCLQSLESLPKDMMTGYKALHFGDICFVPPQRTLNMQWVSLAYLKSLVNDNCFQPEGVKPDAYSSSTAFLIVFLSNEEHECIQHMHIGLVVHCAECNLYRQDRILPFVKSIEADLAKVRDRCTHNKDPDVVHSYTLLVANCGGIIGPFQLTLCIAWCIPLCITMTCRTRTTSTQQPVLQGCAHMLARAAPCFSSWTRIPTTEECMKAAA